MLNCKITFYCGNKTLNKNLGVCEIEGSVLAGVTVGVKVALLETVYNIQLKLKCYNFTDILQM